MDDHVRSEPFSTHFLRSNSKIPRMRLHHPWKGHRRLISIGSGRRSADPLAQGFQATRHAVNFSPPAAAAAARSPGRPAETAD